MFEQLYGRVKNVRSFEDAAKALDKALSDADTEIARQHQARATRQGRKAEGVNLEAVLGALGAKERDSDFNITTKGFVPNQAVEQQVRDYLLSDAYEGASIRRGKGVLKGAQEDIFKYISTARPEEVASILKAVAKDNPQWLNIPENLRAMNQAIANNRSLRIGGAVAAGSGITASGAALVDLMSYLTSSEEQVIERANQLTS
jgi:hypothetical protein